MSEENKAPVVISDCEALILLDSMDWNDNDSPDEDSSLRDLKEDESEEAVGDVESEMVDEEDLSTIFEEITRLKQEAVLAVVDRVKKEEELDVADEKSITLTDVEAVETDEIDGKGYQYIKGSAITSGSVNKLISKDMFERWSRDAEIVIKKETEEMA
tara:strand:+ start:62 stop:535 length:474 start_codon:yes stop_codon:yes gene_type:complete